MNASRESAHSQVATFQKYTSNKGERPALPGHTEHVFANPFQIEDLLVFDKAKLCRVLGDQRLGLTAEHLAWSMHSASHQLIQRFLQCLPVAERACFLQELSRPIPRGKSEAARHLLLDKLFWELTYWKTPEFYEELTVGEQLHPGIFQQLEPLVRGKIVLDAGAGSGRATFEAVRYGASLVYAVEPSPGMLQLLRQKLANHPAAGRIVSCQGEFAHLPLADQSVDLALSCSAFTSEPEQGGEPGLAELRRVTRPGGSIVLIWPRPEDRSWLAEHGFHYVALSSDQEMCVHFPSLQSAFRCARCFYAHNKNVLRYLLKRRQPEIPFSILGINPPCDYCWLQVE